MKTIYSVLLITAFFFSDSDDLIADFSKGDSLRNWYVVNDGVMGGLSKGTLEWNTDGYAVFSGYVTTENNGGFSSIRYAFEERDVSEFSKIVLRLKGDGKKYQFRIKEDPYQRYSYIYNFKTSGDWESITIPFAELYPSYRGYRLNRPNFAGMEMGEIGILIGNKVKEEFHLEMEWIALK